MRIRSAVVLAVGLGAASGACAPACGQTAQDFYRSRQVRMVIAHPVGGDYDVGGRILAKHLAKHIPGNPTIVVQNMPAAGGIVAANYLYGQAPRDGSVFGSFSRNLPNQALMGLANIEADPRRFAFLGATSQPSRVCVNWHTARVKTVEDLFTQELITAGASYGASLSIIPTVLNHVLGTRFKIVEGYKGIPDAMIAIERGEAEGVCSSYGQFRSYERLIRDGKLHILLRAEESPIAEIPDVPSVLAFAKTDEQRQFLRFVLSSTEFGRPYVLPPDVPADRVEVMRKAFAAAVNDPELIAEAEKMKLDMTYRSPAHLERLLADLYRTPPETIESVRKLVPNPQ